MKFNPMILAGVFTLLSAGLDPGARLRAQDPATGLRDTRDFTYTVPAGWKLEKAENAAKVKAYYVLKSGGRPYGEMYLSDEGPAASRTLEAVLEEIVENGRDTMQDYQPLRTAKTTRGGINMLVHDFRYSPAGTGVTFRGRTYFAVINGTVYSFFLNTVESYFDGVGGHFEKIVGSVKAKPPRPVAPAPDAGGAGAVEEHGVTFTLPEGWAPSGDPQGAKYRCHGPDGEVLASLFVFKNDAHALFEHAGPIPVQFDVFVMKTGRQHAEQFPGYEAGTTWKVKIAGVDAAAQDYTFEQDGVRGYYRWYYLPLKDKADAGGLQYPVIPRLFGFMTVRMERLEEMKAQFEGIIQTMKTKHPAAAPTPGGAGTAPNTGTTPGAATLPMPPPDETLPPFEEDDTPGLFRDPAGRFKVPLPEGAQVQTEAGVTAACRVPARKAVVRIWSRPSAAECSAQMDKLGAGKQMSGEEKAWVVAGKNTRIRLYSSPGPAGAKVLSLVAGYPDAGLVLAVEIPAAEYRAQQEWITALIRSVTF